MQRYTIVVLSLLICTQLSLKAQSPYCIEGRFSDANYFSASDIVTLTNRSYGFADTWFAGLVKPDYNFFDISFPDMEADTLSARPLIVLAHGGAFWGGDKEELDSMIIELSKKGYVAVSLNYRRGWDNNLDFSGCTGDGASLQKAIYMSMQDIRACLRYLVVHAADYGIDTAAIFVGGESAGAFAMLNSIYISQEEWNSQFPYFDPSLGDLDSATNDLTASYDVKGFINISGGIMDTAFIADDELRPTISFYGVNDDIVPPLSGYFQGCPNYVPIFGSLAIRMLLTREGLCAPLHARIGYGHVAYDHAYVTGNMACFIRSLFCGTCVDYTVNYEEADCSDGSLTATENTGQDNTPVIFPNPADACVNMRLTSTGNLQTAVFLDATGSALPVPFRQSGNILTFDTSRVPPGMYFIRVEADNNTIGAGCIIH